MLFWIAVAAVVGAAVGWWGGMNPGPWDRLPIPLSQRRDTVVVNDSYAAGWEAGYEAAEEMEDEALAGFETTYDWRNNAPERGRREKANQATH